MRAAATILAIGVLAASGWMEPVRAYLDAYRSYFFAGKNSTADFHRLSALKGNMARTAAPYGELRDALVDQDRRLGALAVAYLAVAEHTEPRLAALVLERFPREGDPATRHLSLMAIAGAGSDWVRRRGPDIVRALEDEREPNVMTVAAVSILPLLDTHDLVAAAAALASNGDETYRRVLCSAVYVHAGGSGLQALAERLRREGRADLAVEVEKFRAASEHTDGGG